MANDLNCLAECPDREHAGRVLEQAARDAALAVRERLEEQSASCTVCARGLQCAKCAMGPCRVDPDGPDARPGACGANADLTVARNFGRAIAAGAAAHGDQARELLEALRAAGEKGTVADPEKLTALCAELGLDHAGLDVAGQVRALLRLFFDNFGTCAEALTFVSRAPAARRAVWEHSGTTPRGVDRECVAMLRRTTLGDAADPAVLCRQALRTALADGWGAAMIGTAVGDILSGTPQPTRVELAADAVTVTTGYSVEAIFEAMGGSLDPLIKAFRIGMVRGVVGVIACEACGDWRDGELVELVRELVAQDILVLAMGGGPVPLGRAGLLDPAGTEQAGSGLADFCDHLDLPPVLHVDGDLDHARFLELCAQLADTFGVDMAALPVAVSVPEGGSEKTLAAGLCAVASGLSTHLGCTPNILGGPGVAHWALHGLEDAVGAAFVLQPDPVRAVEAISRQITVKRLALGLNDRFDGTVYS